MLDTTNPEALEAGLKTCKNRVIINGFSIEPHKLEHILPLACRFDADIVGFLLMDDGQVPSDETEQLNVAVELYRAFVDTGLPREKLIIDPIIAPVLWDNGMEHNRKAYLAMLAASGLTMVLLNIFHRDTVQMTKTCNLLMGSEVFTWEEIP